MAAPAAPAARSASIRRCRSGSRAGGTGGSVSLTNSGGAITTFDISVAGGDAGVDGANAGSVTIGAAGDANIAGTIYAQGGTGSTGIGGKGGAVAVGSSTSLG